MRRFWIVAVTVAVMLVSWFGCGRDGDEAPPGSADRTPITDAEAHTSASGEVVGKGGSPKPEGTGRQERSAGAKRCGDEDRGGMPGTL